MKWAKERDSLIAQTRAFVNSVIAWKADTALPSESVQPVAIENTFAVTPREEPGHVEAIEKPETQEETEEETKESAQALPTAELTSPTPPSIKPPSIKPPSAEGTPSANDALQKEEIVQIDARKEIENRVAAFQAHQHRFAREREAYFNSVLTKARSALDGKNEDSGLDKPSA